MNEVLRSHPLKGLQCIPIPLQLLTEVVQFLTGSMRYKVKHIIAGSLRQIWEADCPWIPAEYLNKLGENTLEECSSNRAEEIPEANEDVDLGILGPQSLPDGMV